MAFVSEKETVIEALERHRQLLYAGSRQKLHRLGYRFLRQPTAGPTHERGIVGWAYRRGIVRGNLPGSAS
jgi:hypothetical protein